MHITDSPSGSCSSSTVGSALMAAIRFSVSPLVAARCASGRSVSESSRSPSEQGETSSSVSQVPSGWATGAFPVKNVPFSKRSEHGMREVQYALWAE